MLFLLWHVVRRIFTLRHTPETSFTNTSYTLILSIPFCPLKKKRILIMSHKNDFKTHLGVTIWKHWDSASEIGLESCLLPKETFMLNLSESRAATGRLRGKSHFNLPQKWNSGADVGGRAAMSPGSLQYRRDVLVSYCSFCFPWKIARIWEQ